MFNGKTISLCQLSFKSLVSIFQVTLNLKFQTGLQIAGSIMIPMKLRWNPACFGLGLIHHGGILRFIVKPDVGIENGLVQNGEIPLYIWMKKIMTNHGEQAFFCRIVSDRLFILRSQGCELSNKAPVDLLWPWVVTITLIHPFGRFHICI